jgi:hypothetical protein
MMSCGFSSCTEHVSACLCSAGLNSGRSTMRSTLITRASRPWVICTLFPRCFPLGILQMSYFFVFWWVRWARQQGKSGELYQRKWVISPIPSTFCFRFRSNIVPM